MQSEHLSSVSDALQALRSGRMIVVVDDEDRENEGDLIFPAQCITEEKMVFIIHHTGGVVCLALSNAIADQLQLPLMVEKNTSKLQTPYTVSIEAAEGVTTGISAADRAHTVIRAINPVALPSDLRRPGHVFPLRAQDGGVLVRAGHTEAAVDLMKLAGMREGAVISELMLRDGTMMRLPAIRKFAALYEFPVLSIADLIAYRQKFETCIRREASTILETETGEWNMHVYTDTLKNEEHIALVKGNIVPENPTLVRVHSECLTGDTFGSHHCDCGHQLQLAMQKIAQEKTGVVLYLRQEGRGVGLLNKVRAYALQKEASVDTVEANARLGFANDLREYGIGAQILKDIGVGFVRLLTNNPRKVIGIHGYGLHVIEQVALEKKGLTEKQKRYLYTKKKKMGHKISSV
jgi:3,4-dihydroxy 2-butanone 4-phosphate synthase / GTP cyclohydrolase II